MYYMKARAKTAASGLKIPKVHNFKDLRSELKTSKTGQT